MKKLDNKIFKEKDEGQKLIDSSDADSDTITCDCRANERLSSPQSTTIRDKDNESYDGEELEHLDKQNKRSLSGKLLILIGLTLTIHLAVNYLFLLVLL